MKRILPFAAALLLAGCGSAGVPQEQYESAIAEVAQLESENADMKRRILEIDSEKIALKNEIATKDSLLSEYRIASRAYDDYKDLMEPFESSAEESMESEEQSKAESLQAMRDAMAAAESEKESIVAENAGNFPALIESLTADYDIPTSVTLDGTTLKIKVKDLSIIENATDVMKNQIAINAAAAITDTLLEYPEYDGLWDTVIVDFGGYGKTTSTKADIGSGTAGRYFNNLALE